MSYLQPSQLFGKKENRSYIMLHCNFYWFFSLSGSNKLAHYRYDLEANDEKIDKKSTGD